MPAMDEDEYGDIADEDLIEALSQASQTLPPLSLSPRPAKRRRGVSEESDANKDSSNPRRKSRETTGSGGSGDEEENGKSKKKKYRIHLADKDVPAAKIIGATQAEALPDSSPYRIRGPIYKKSRPEPPSPPPKAPECSTTPPRRPIPKSNPFQKQPSNPFANNSFDQELEGLPSDAFSSPEQDQISTEPILIGSSPLRDSQQNQRPRQRLVAPQQGLRQTTLFGGRALEEVSASQAKKVYNFIVDKPPEPPTHHTLNEEALKTWVYPTNLGAIRDYQFSIVRNGLFHNTLVALPTGLGKTFIAATIMLNFFRWTKVSQIVFVAPTKPLVAQQVDACFNIVGIPKSQTTMLTGEQPPALRAEEWEEKRVFFMTPQTLQNDLATGIADPKKIVLLVVDEAHRATGNYAYVTVVQFLRRFNKSFRVLALTATPGASVEAVQEVVDNLEISKVEIRTEESIDIRQYVHRRDIDQILLDPSDEIVMVKELFAKALQPLVNQLCGQNAYWNKDPMALTPYGLMQARKSWMMSDAGRRANPGLKGMLNSLFTILASVAHAIKLLNFHGIGPFYSSVKDFRQGVEDNNKPGKYRSQIVDSPDFKKMMDRIQLWLSKDDFIGHPKMTYLCDTILNHFMDAGEGRLGQDAPPSSTRVIVFAEFRDSAEDIARVLNRHGPMIRASVFVGQADSKRSEGMNQAKQQETINKFKSGKFNVIVATSIGEEGLDIGQVDLIVCYDSSSSPIRMLQRLGRTGRKRAGNIVLLLMRGKEEESFIKAKDNYEQMQKMISSGTRFNFRHDLSARIVPRDITPVVDKKMTEIPIENTQNPGLPEPKRRPNRAKKKPPKKFHMPDGVQTGFQKASKLSEDGAAIADFGITVNRSELDKSQLAPIPPLESVLLSSGEEKELARRYQNIAGEDVQEVEMPDMTSQPIAQRSLGHAVNVPHGQHTKRSVKLFQTLARSQLVEDRYVMPYGDEEPTRTFWNPPALVEDEGTVTKVSVRAKKTTPAKRRQIPKAPKQLKRLKISKASKASRPIFDSSDMESDGEESGSELPRCQKSGAISISCDDSEGEGEDLRSEDCSEDSESDDVGSLKDFLASEDHLMGTGDISMVRSSTSPPPTGPQSKPKGFVIPAPLPSTQDTNVDDDDDFPALGELTGAPAKQNPVLTLDEGQSDEDMRPVSRHREKRRRVVDSDSDE
jgi:ATP-dependent DNA helicase MPH1